MKYTTDQKMTSKEIRKFLANEYGVKVSHIESSYNAFMKWVDGYIYKGKARYEFIYYKTEGVIQVYSKTYAVRYLRETPFGYGGGWTTMPVQADSEAEALEIAEASCRKEWGNLSPCSRFSVVDWK